MSVVFLFSEENRGVGDFKRDAEKKNN